MRRLAYLIAGLSFGLVASAIGQPTPIQENTAALKRLTDIQVAASNAAGMLVVTNQGVLLARCVENAWQAERLGYQFDRLPVCAREVVPDAIDDAWKDGYDEGQRSATDAAEHLP